MDLDTAFGLIIGVLLVARVAMKRDVPMLAFYLLCAGWGSVMLWHGASRVLEFVLLFLRFEDLVDYRDRTTVVGLIHNFLYPLMGGVLIVGILVAARGAVVETAPEAGNGPPKPEPPKTETVKAEQPKAAETPKE
jgi:hypothetical protein